MTPPPPTSRLSDLLGDDHRELDTVFEEFRTTPVDEPARRTERFHAFAEELRTHIALEEEHLFPRFGEGDPVRHAMVETMLEEHRRILDVLVRTEGRLAGGDGRTEDLEEELINVLWAHNAREENAVYPWFDEHLSPAESDPVVRTLTRRPGPSRPD